MSTLEQVGDRCAHLTASVLPWLALGLVGAAVIRVVTPVGVARVFAGRHGLVAALATGALLPTCSRGTVPLVMALRGTPGQRLGTLTVLVFVAPLLSPLTVALSWSMLGWRMAFARVLAALVGAALLGVLINHNDRWFDSPGRPAPPMLTAPGADSCGTPGSALPGCGLGPVARRVVSETLTLARQVTAWFVAGILAASLVTVLLPPAAIPHLLGGAAGPVTFLLAAILGAPLSVCQGEEVPLTYAVLASGVAAGPALTFLLGSVGLCLPTVLISRTVLTPRIGPVYLGFWISWAILAGAAFQLLGR